MSVELISILIAGGAVGATPVGLMLNGQRAIRTEPAAQRRDFNTEQTEPAFPKDGLDFVLPQPCPRR